MIYSSTFSKYLGYAAGNNDNHRIQELLRRHLQNIQNQRDFHKHSLPLRPKPWFPGLYLTNDNTQTLFESIYTLISFGIVIF